jgi:hypothetical protein
MAKLSITELDFESIKGQLKAYMKGQTKFKDYDFEGSNMSVLLDVLSYNTFQNNFYTNMAINEMFIDSALLRNSLISHAKELNYLPRSKRSARAIVKVKVTDNTLTGQTITIPQYAEFAAAYQGEQYTFVTNKAHVLRKVAPNTYESGNITIYEGTMLTSFEREGFFVDDDGILRVILTNENADTDSIEAFVDAEATEDRNVFVRKDTIFGVGPTDKVFYVEPYFDGRYTVYFGKNIFGLQPTEIEDVRVKYRITSGAEANGINKFNIALSSTGKTVVTTIARAVGGADEESIESIRFNAPKALQIQERAVTASDYENLLKQKFPEILSVSAYGGDELEPPQFGKVAISVYLGQETEILSASLAATYIDYLREKSPLAVEPIFRESEFLYANIEVDAYYSSVESTKSPGQIESIIRDEIQYYSNTYLDDFNKTLRVSNIASAIDKKDVAILSNSVCAFPYIPYSPATNVKLNPTFKFGAKLAKPYPFRNANGFSEYKPAIKTGKFTSNAQEIFLQDDGLGNIMSVTSNAANPQIVKPRVGTVDYETGTVSLTDFITDEYDGSEIKIIARTAVDDIKSPLGRIFYIRDTDVTVNMIEIK